MAFFTKFQNITNDVNAFSDSVGSSVDAVKSLDSQLNVLNKSVEQFSQLSRNINLTSELEQYLNILSQISSTYKTQIDEIQRLKPDNLLVDPAKEIQGIEQF